MKRTNEQKLDGIKAELTILLPRLTPQYRKGIETCIEWIDEVKADIPGHILRNEVEK